MTKTFRATPMRRAFNGLVVLLHRLAVPTGGIVSLTSTGRRTGQPRTTPVSPIEVNETRYLIAPYGAVDWVRNVRATPASPSRAVAVPSGCARSRSRPTRLRP